MTTEFSVGAASDTKVNRPTINWRQIHRNVRRLQVRIVKATQTVAKPRPIRALERLERHMVKVIRAVLRGGLRHEVAYMFVVLEYP